MHLCVTRFVIGGFLTATYNDNTCKTIFSLFWFHVCMYSSRPFIAHHDNTCKAMFSIFVFLSVCRVLFLPVTLHDSTSKGMLRSSRFPICMYSTCHNHYTARQHLQGDLCFVSVSYLCVQRLPVSRHALPGNLRYNLFSRFLLFNTLALCTFSLENPMMTDTHLCLVPYVLFRGYRSVLQRSPGM